jgi:putative transposase
MEEATEKLPTIRKLWLDGGYRGRCVRWMRTALRLDAEVVLRRDDRLNGVWQQQDLPLPKAEPIFRVVPRRWVVERTFGWMGRFRRLSKDYEALVETSEAWIWIAMCRLLIQRIAHPAII